MEFGNPIVGGDTLVRDAIHSQNFVTGASGWTVNRDGSAEFNNVTIRNGETVGGTQLFYSGTPGAGNLIASISDSQGTDQYGNTYFVGICNYTTGQNPNTFVQLLAGQVFSGLVTDNINNTAMLGYNKLTNTERGTYPAAELISPTDGIYTYRGSVLIAPGNDSTWANAPRIFFIEKNGGSRLHAVISGSLQVSDVFGNVLKSTVVGAPGAPTFNTGWQTATSYASIGACEPLQYSLLPDGRVHLHGAFGIGATAPTLNALFALPNGYFRTDKVTLFRWQGQIGNTGNEVHGSGSIQTNGNVQVSSTNTTSASPRVANSTYWIDAIFDGPDVQ